jgi:hypothetical protein
VTGPDLGAGAPIVGKGKFPTDDAIKNYNGIINALGLGVKYNFNQAVVVIDTYLASPAAGVAVTDRPAVRSNFVHISIEHPDMLYAYFGFKATFDTTVEPYTVAYSIAP